MFDGNGNWTSDFSAESDRDNNIKILASRFDGIFIADLKESFENCLTKDGQIAPIGAFNMGGQKITNLANGTNLGDAVNLSQLDNNIETMLSTLYPVGSLYFGTQSGCPLSTLIAGSTWTKVATKIVTNVDSTVTVKGNSKALGLRSGSKTFSMVTDSNDAILSTSLHTPSGANVGSVPGGTHSSGYTRYEALGVDTNASNSGLTGTATSTTLTLNIWKRTA